MTYYLAITWLCLTGGCLAISLAWGTAWPNLALPLYSGWTILLSGVAFLVYAIDKRRARHEAWRIPERVLHGLSAVGGWPGSVLAQQLLRHKSRKVGFRLVLVGIVVLHVAFVVTLSYLTR